MIVGLEITLNVPLVKQGMFKVSSGILLTPLPSEEATPTVCMNVLFGELYSRLERKNGLSRKKFLRETLKNHFHLLDVTFGKSDDLDTVIFHHPEKQVEHFVNLFLTINEGSVLKPYVLDDE